jgi:alginate export protein
MSETVQRHTPLPRRRPRRPGLLLWSLACLALTTPARADDTTPAPQRPTIAFNRWQEDWSVLADPRVPPQPFDALKYIPLSPFDPKTYLSFGGNVRERFETNDAQAFGTGPNHAQSYLISRTELHADLRIASQLQIFTQIQSDFAPWKTMLTPVDQNRLDLEQAFIALTEPVGDGTLKLRLGRQQFGFDLQRFVSVRDGPNVRQSYDAAWADYETGPWRFITFYSHPVQVQDNSAFDDYSSSQQTFGGVRIERKLTATTNVSAYYTHFTQADVHFPNASGDERRESLDVRFNGTAGHVDWDIEAMGQGGSIGGQDIAAWAFGSLAGYTFADLGWTPRVGLQVDAASGDSHAPGHSFGTFNPLFPNGYYVALAGYTGFVNFIHIKPSLTLHPTSSLKLMLAVASQWRETTSDAVYTQPDIPVPNTAGRPGRYTGSYGQVRLDWAFDRATSFAVEAVHFVVGDAIRNAGGRDSNYFGAEVKYGW